MIAKDDHLRIY